MPTISLHIKRCVYEDCTALLDVNVRPNGICSYHLSPKPKKKRPKKKDLAIPPVGS